MADYHQPQEASYGGGQQRISGRTVLCASLAGVAIGGPLSGMAGFSFLASATLLLLSSPLLVIFSPLLLGAGAVLIGAMAGFGMAIAMGLVGLASFGWISKEVGATRPLRLGLYGEEMKEQGKGLAGYLLNQADEKLNRG